MSIKAKVPLCTLTFREEIAKLVSPLSNQDARAMEKFATLSKPTVALGKVNARLLGRRVATMARHRGPAALGFICAISVGIQCATFQRLDITNGKQLIYKGYEHSTDLKHGSIADIIFTFGFTRTDAWRMVTEGTPNTKSAFTLQEKLARETWRHYSQRSMWFPTLCMYGRPLLLLLLFSELL